MSSTPNVTGGVDPQAPAPAVTRPPLTAERIVNAAMHLIEAQGLAQLSIRRLGEALGVQGMAVYRHLAGKDAILDGVRQALIGMFADRMSLAAPFTDWREHLRTFGEVYREVGRTHPEAFPLLASGGDTAWAHGIEASGEVLNALLAAGFDLDTAMTAKRTVVRYVLGFSLGDAPDDSALEDLVETRDNRKSASGGGARSSSSDEELFETGLELILDGLAARLPMPRGAPTPRP